MSDAILPFSPPGCLMSRIVIVVPCYNEAERLCRPAFLEYAAANSDVEFLFVDDGSTDATAGMLAALSESSVQITWLQLPANVGKAEAVRQGMLAAFQSGAVNAGFWDADLATPLYAIRKFADVLEETPAVDMVMGARVQLLGRRIERRSRRHYAGRVFATAASLVTGLGVYDTQCGAKLFRTSPAMQELFARPFISRWIFDVEILARLICGRPEAPAADAVYELPLVEWRDVSGSKVRGRDFVTAAWELLGIYLRYFSRFATPRRTYSAVEASAASTSPADCPPIPAVPPATPSAALF